MNQLIINTNNDQKKEVIYTFIDLTIIQIYLLAQNLMWQNHSNSMHPPPTPIYTQVPPHSIRTMYNFEFKL